MGRVGYFLQGTDAPLQRDELAHELLFLTRGQPVVYYGDEQGFAGTGGDQSARQTLFPTQVAEYQNQPLVTGETFGTGEHLATDVPLYGHIATLADLRAAHPALATGAQIERYVDSGAGVYAFSRVDRTEQVEYLVAANNSNAAKTVDVPTLTKDGAFAVLYGDGASVTANADGVASVTVPALGTVVLKADRTVTAPDAASAISVAAPAAGAGVAGVTPVAADVDDATWQETSFAWRVAGSDEWHALGTAEDTSPRVFHDTAGLANGTLLEYRAVSTDAAGNRAAASTYASVGNAVNLVEEEEPEQPIELVTVPGSHNSEMGCAGDWAPGCEAAKLTLRADGIYAGTFAVPAGSYEYKVALNGSWDVNYGANGEQNGGNIAYTTDGTKPVTFYWNPDTKVVSSSAEGPVVTLPGNFQSQIGCPGDWQPDCLASLMQDGDKDGVYTFATDELDDGSYEVKVAHGTSWDENYGVGGAPGGANYTFTATAGKLVEFRYTLATHVLEIVVTDPPLAGTGESRAHWVSEDTLAWPAELLGGASADDATWTLEHSADAGLAVAEGAVTGGDEPVALELDAAGLSDAQLAKFPALEGYLALHPVGLDRGEAQQLLTEQLAVAQTTDGALSAFTGVQVPGVLDDLYADALASTPLGATVSGEDATVRLWAPTARSVSLEVWESGATGDPTRHAGRLRPGRRHVERRRRLGRRRVPLVGRGLRADHGRDRDQLGHRPVLGRAHDELGSHRDREPRRRLAEARAVGRDARAHRGAPGRPRDLRAARARLLDRRRDRAGRGAGHLPSLHARLGGHGAAAASSRRPASTPCTCCRRSTSRPSRRTAQRRRPPRATWPRSVRHRPSSRPASTSIRDLDGFNWGYDPFHFQAPEGSYAVDPNGGARVAEFREMVGALHATGLQVVLDEVYNHTAASGQGEKSVLDRIVPGYYQRLNTVGNVETSTCCQNVATEHEVAEKLMVDSVVLWAREYKVDGFRFDLMGHHSKQNMLAVRAALDELTLEADGVDGKAVYLYGEGWNFGEVADNALFEQATQGQLGGTGIGTFNDRLRDGVHGGSPVDGASTFDQGFGTGLGTDPNGSPIDAAQRPPTLGHQTDLVKLGLAGNLRGFELTDCRRARPCAATSSTTAVIAGRLRRPARRGDQLRRRPRQRDALRPLGVQAADGHVDGRPRAHEHAVARDGDAVAVALVLARRHRAAALEVARPQQLQLGRLVQPHRLDRPGVDLRVGPAERGRQRREVVDHGAAAREPRAQAGRCGHRRRRGIRPRPAARARRGRPAAARLGGAHRREGLASRTADRMPRRASS